MVCCVRVGTIPRPAAQPNIFFSGISLEGLSSRVWNPTCDISEGMRRRVRVKVFAPKVRVSKGLP